MSEIAVEVTRNGIIESVHRADVCIVNSEGKVLFSLGDIDRITFFRSSAKPVILISNMQKGIVEKFNFNHKELAIMASSHSGGEEHIKVLESIAKKIGITRDDLACGIRPPFGKEEMHKLLLSGKEPNELHNNCSGKHMGTLAACIALNYDTSGYEKKEHRVQKDIIKTISEFSNMDTNEIIVGIDGCGFPVYAMPLKNIAYCYANLFNTKFYNGIYSKNQESLYESVKAYPEMIASHERIDSKMIKFSKGKLFGKMGAEGVFCICDYENRIGAAIKIEDGSIRALDPVVCEIIKQANLARLELLNTLSEHHYPEIKTYSGIPSGHLNPIFKLKSHK